MPVTFAIIEDGHVVSLAVSAPWQIADLLKVYVDEELYFSTCTFKVHTLFDLSNMYHIPMGAIAARNSPNIMHVNSGQVAVLGAAPFVKTIALLAFRMSHFNRAFFFDKEAVALAHLRTTIAAEMASSDRSVH